MKFSQLGQGAIFYANGEDKDGGTVGEGELRVVLSQLGERVGLVR